MGKKETNFIRWCQLQLFRERLSSRPPLEHFPPLLECSPDCIKRPGEKAGKAGKADDGHCRELNALADYHKQKTEKIPHATPNEPLSWKLIISTKLTRSNIQGTEKKRSYGQSTKEVRIGIDADLKKYWFVFAVYPRELPWKWRNPFKYVWFASLNSIASYTRTRTKTKQLIKPKKCLNQNFCATLIVVATSQQNANVAVHTNRSHLCGLHCRWLHTMPHCPPGHLSCFGEICNAGFHYSWASLLKGPGVCDGPRWRNAGGGVLYLLTSGMACKPQINWLG